LIKIEFLTLRYGLPEELPIVLLAGHEGGGLDWTRKIIESASGFFCGIDNKQQQMELNLGLGSGYDIFDKVRDDANHDVDDGTQLVTQTFRGIYSC
jgi:hypothetical protein